jgi:hypothetical protein
MMAHWACMARTFSQVYPRSGRVKWYLPTHREKGGCSS